MGCKAIDVGEYPWPCTLHPLRRAAMMRNVYAYFDQSASRPVPLVTIRRVDDLTPQPPRDRGDAPRVQPAAEGHLAAHVFASEAGLVFGSGGDQKAEAQQAMRHSEGSSRGEGPRQPRERDYLRQEQALRPSPAP